MFAFSTSIIRSRSQEQKGEHNDTKDLEEISEGRESYQREDNDERLKLCSCYFCHSKYTFP